MTMQMQKSSMGHIANHTYDRSIAKYMHDLCHVPISGYPESIFLTARRGGDPFTEIAFDYTFGSTAARTTRSRNSRINALKNNESMLSGSSTPVKPPIRLVMVLWYTRQWYTKPLIHYHTRQLIHKSQCTRLPIHLQQCTRLPRPVH
jgi:hypothetical protein